MRRTGITIAVDGITVSCDGPVEALDAVQADAFEVEIPAPESPEERRRRAAILAEWVREQRATQAR